MFTTVLLSDGTITSPIGGGLENAIGAENLASSGIGNIMSAGQILVFILSLIFVIVLAAWVTRLVAASRFKYNGRNLRVIESMGVGGQASVQLIRVGEKNILVGITKERVSYLCEIDADEVVMPDSTNIQPMPFKKVLERFQKQGDNTDGGEDN